MEIKLQEKVDMHIHSTYSDGRKKISELVDMIEDANLKAVVLTDHDRVYGLPEFMDLCEKNGVDSMTGVEISSTDITVERQTVDILGYGFDARIISGEHKNLLEHNLNVRIEYLEKVLELYKEKGLMKKLDLIKLGNSFGLPVRVANKYWLIAARANNLNKIAKIPYEIAFEVAERELRKGEEYFVEKDKYVSTKEAINAIKESGGIAVWAHPMKTFEKLRKCHKDGDVERIFSNILGRMIREGLDGIEVYNPYTTELWKNIFLLNYAESCKLIVTGGSDFHGHDGLTKDRLGQAGISYGEFLKIKEEISSRQ